MMGFLSWMPKLMAIFQLIQVVIPLVKTVEEAITGKGTGILKKEMIMRTVDGVAKIASDANIIRESDAAELSGIAPLVSGLIDMVVGLFHSAGEFTHSEEELQG